MVRVTPSRASPPPGQSAGLPARRTAPQTFSRPWGSQGRTPPPSWPPPAPPRDPRSTWRTGPFSSATPPGRPGLPPPDLHSPENPRSPPNLLSPEPPDPCSLPRALPAPARRRRGRGRHTGPQPGSPWPSREPPPDPRARQASWGTAPRRLSCGSFPDSGPPALLSFHFHIRFSPGFFCPPPREFPSPLPPVTFKISSIFLSFFLRNCEETEK